MQKNVQPKQFVSFARDVCPYIVRRHADDGNLDKDGLGNNDNEKTGVQP